MPISRHAAAASLVATLTVASTVARTAALSAQAVPARDLLHLPLGSMDRAAPLAGGAGDGIGNPAAIALDSSVRIRVGAAALATPGDQGVSAQLLAGSLRLPQAFTVGLSVARYDVSDIFRTETDPTTLGAPIDYGTTLFSATVARVSERYVSTGLAARYRRGTSGSQTRGALGVDAGVLVRGLPAADLNVGASTFLWRPANRDAERAEVNLAADLRLLGEDDRHQLRGAYAETIGDRGYREHFILGSLRYEQWEGRAGFVRTDAFGSRIWRTRLGVVLHYASYVIGVAREDNGAGLSASYQFSLTANLK